MNLDEFGTKDDRMSRIKKHGKTMKIWLTTVAGCFMSGCKNHRMGEPARLGNDSTQITATLEFIAATILICKARESMQTLVFHIFWLHYTTFTYSKDLQSIEARAYHEIESVTWWGVNGLWMGLAIDSICPWSRSSPGLKLVLPPRSTDFFIIPWDQLDVNTSEICCVRCESFGFWNVGIWYSMINVWPETSELPSETQFWFAVAWDCLQSSTHWVLSIILLHGSGQHRVWEPERVRPVFSCPMIATPGFG